MTRLKQHASDTVVCLSVHHVIAVKLVSLKTLGRQFEIRGGNLSKCLELSRGTSGKLITCPNDCQGLFFLFEHSSVSVIDLDTNATGLQFPS